MTDLLKFLKIFTSFFNPFQSHYRCEEKSEISKSQQFCRKCVTRQNKSGGVKTSTVTFQKTTMEVKEYELNVIFHSNH